MSTIGLVLPEVSPCNLTLPLNLMNYLYEMAQKILILWWASLLDRHTEFF